jgi:acetoacetyl-CoA synthetase
MLGCDVRAFDPDGHECAPGETGELVICTPMPSMPTMLWGDESGERLRAAYFERFPGVWHHGDWIRFEADGSCVITGRSDATLNRGGVRLGTAEFYSVTDSHPALADSIVVHLEDASGGPGVLIMLIASRSGEVLDDDALADLRRQLRERLSPRHVPDLIQQFPAIPRTLTGKRIEVPVKRLLTGGDPSKVTSREALTDPAAFDAIATWAAAYSRNLEQMSR